MTFIKVADMKINMEQAEAVYVELDTDGRTRAVVAMVSGDHHKFYEDKQPAAYALLIKFIRSSKG